MKKTIAWSRLLKFILIGFFLLGAFMNLLGPASIAEEFARWGYPSWFRYVTGALELVVAALLGISKYRVYGIVLGGLIMLSAMLTLVIHLEMLHAAAPALTLVGLGMLHRKRN